MTKKEKIAIISSLLYIGIMAVGMLVVKNVSGSSYESPDMVNTLIYFEVVMTLFGIFVYRKYFSGLSFNKVEKLSFGLGAAGLFTVLFFSVIGVGVFQFMSVSYDGKNMNLLMMIALTTLLVGVSEELVFRGILLPVFAERRGKITAVLASSVMFGLLHSVNILGGLSVEFMLVQLVSASVSGVFFACVALEIKNIIPLMIHHWLWDAVIISGAYLEAESGGLMFLLFLMEFLFTLTLFILLVKKSKKTIQE